MGRQSLYPATSILGGKRVVTDLKTAPSSPAYNYWATATHTGLAEAMSISIPNVGGSTAKSGGDFFGKVYNSLKQQADNERKKEDTKLIPLVSHLSEVCFFILLPLLVLTLMIVLLVFALRY